MNQTEPINCLSDLFKLEEERIIFIDVENNSCREVAGGADILQLAVVNLKNPAEKEKTNFLFRPKYNLSLRIMNLLEKDGKYFSKFYQPTAFKEEIVDLLDDKVVLNWGDSDQAWVNKTFQTDYHFVDLGALLEKEFQILSGLSLVKVAFALKIEQDEDKLHDAYEDAELLKKVFLKLQEEYFKDQEALKEKLFLSYLAPEVITPMYGNYFVKYYHSPITNELVAKNTRLYINTSGNRNSQVTMIYCNEKSQCFTETISNQTASKKELNDFYKKLVKWSERSLVFTNRSFDGFSDLLSRCFKSTNKYLKLEVISLKEKKLLEIEKVLGLENSKEVSTDLWSHYLSVLNQIPLRLSYFKNYLKW